MSATAGERALLEVSGLTVRYGAGPQAPGVDDVSFSVSNGEVVALIGESGSGKSTIANSILGLLPSAARIRGGQVRLDGLELAALDGPRAWQEVRGRRVAFIPQDPHTALNPVKRVGVQAVERLRLYGPPAARPQQREAVEGLFDRVGIADPARVFDAYPHELSGGMKQRVLIAIALSTQPRLVIADEPTSGLDVTVQRLVLDELRGIAAARGVGVVLITHDLAVAEHYADRVVVLRRGRVVEQLRTEALASDAIDPYTRLLFDAAPSSTTERLRPSPRAEARASTGDAARVTPASDTRPASAAHALLEVRDLRKAFRGRGKRAGEHVAVDAVSFDVARGTTFGLVGQSGSGKTTTARIVAGLDTPSSGAVRHDGVDQATLSREQRRAIAESVQYVFQNPYASLDPRHTVGRIVEEPLAGFRVGDRQARVKRVDEYLDAVEIPRSYRSRRPAELSGGQRQRVAIARALVLGPRLLVLDEPVSALDVSVQATVLQLLVDLQTELGLTYVFISHDLAVVRLIADRVGVLHRGRLVDEGAVGDVFREPSSEHTRELIDAVVPARSRSL